jgi:hypothetical protein
MARVLVACEWSGIAREAFRDAGHDAVSCDLEPSARPGPHHQGDVRAILGDGWDLLLAFPPCRYLANSGARWWAQRQEEQQEALAFVATLLAAPIPHICLENPPGRICSALRPYSQVIHPWEYGEPEEKVTGLWLVGLPYLQPTCLMAQRTQRIWRMGESKQRSRTRARTYPGIARAMAAQWGPRLERGAA